MAQRIGKELALAGREVIVRGDGMACGEQPIDQVAADETGAASDEIVHETSIYSPLAPLRGRGEKGQAAQCAGAASCLRTALSSRLTPSGIGSRFSIPNSI